MKCFIFSKKAVNYRMLRNLYLPIIVVTLSLFTSFSNAFLNERNEGTEFTNRKEAPVEIRDGLYFYPSPFTDTLNIHAEYKVHVRVMDANGEEIKSATLEGERAMYKDLDKGVYVLKFFTPFGTYFKRVVKE